MSKILVVDRDREAVATLCAALDPLGHEVATAQDVRETLQELQDTSLALVILDLSWPDAGGMEALRGIRQSHPQVPVIVITGRGTVETAIEATKLGTFDYQLKPFDSANMLRIAKRALDGFGMMRDHKPTRPRSALAEVDVIVGACPAMQEVYKAIGRVAAADATVLVRGESGTGKELIARAIHQHSCRCAKPLVVVNCAAIPETLLEGELFGCERGAFTGAVSRRIGRLEQAHGGTVLLDEIGDIPLSIQIKILRVLQERCFERLGGNETLQVDVRLLAATNRNLERAIAEGLFRADLYHRLNVVTIRVPPLRERLGDVPLLVDHFLERFSRELALENPAMAGDALEALCAHSWPGNVRELRHCIHRAMIFTRGYCIQTADLPLPSPAQIPEDALDCPEFEHRLSTLVRDYLQRSGGAGAHERCMATLERLLLSEALRRSRGNRSQAARLLGLPRPTLHTKLQKYDMPAVRELVERQFGNSDGKPVVQTVPAERTSDAGGPSDAKRSNDSDVSQFQHLSAERQMIRFPRLGPSDS